MIKTIDLRKLIPCLLIPIFTGLIGSIFSSNAKEVYSPLNKPPFSPPSIIFPFVWTALYILIGIGLYFMEESGCDKKNPRIAYGVMLALNILWPLFFFTFTYLPDSARSLPYWTKKISSQSFLTLRGMWGFHIFSIPRCYA